MCKTSFLGGESSHVAKVPNMGSGKICGDIKRTFQKSIPLSKTSFVGKKQFHGPNAPKEVSDQSVGIVGRGF